MGHPILGGSGVACPRLGDVMQSREQECAASHRAGSFPQLTPHSLKRVLTLFKSNLTPEIKNNPVDRLGGVFG